MKNYPDLLTGILIGTVVGGMYASHLGIILQVAFGLLVLTFAVKVLGLLK